MCIRDRCSVTAQYSSFCDDHNRDVVVYCYSTRLWDSPTSGQIRLTGGNFSNQGLLEIYCNGEWGTVCDDGFFSTEAQVACRQLGYNDYYDYDHLSISGTFSQPIWLDNVDCSSSSYTCLTTCESCPSSESVFCSHSEDITLDCSYSLFNSDVSTTTSSTCSTDSSVSAGTIAGAVVGVIFGIIFCILIFTVPFCICCCLGVGVGASSRRSPITRVVAHPTTTTTTAVITTEETNTSNFSPTKQDPPPSYFQPPPQENPYPTAYPTQPGYPQQPPGYPAGGYPGQSEYQQYPGYPQPYPPTQY